MTSFDRTDLTIAAVVLVAAAWVGTAAVGKFRAAAGVAEFYQSELGPAVMTACGHGFQNPDAKRIPTLDAFLSRRSDAFACTSLPQDVPTIALSPFQSSSRYLQLAAAITWKVIGISWASLDVLSGLCFGAVATLTFGILRVGLRRAYALPATLAALLWPPNFTLAPQLRDYAKGPFLLAVLLIMALIVMRSGGRRVFIWAVIVGAIVGVGIGFRTDLLIAVIPIVIAIAVLSPPNLSVRRRGAAVAAFVAVMVMVGWPALQGYARGGNTAHVALLGVANDFDRTLRVEPSVYELLGPYNDTMAFSVVNAYAARTGHPTGADLSTAAYDRFASEYLQRLATTFPADVITRFLAALRAVPRYVLDTSLTPPPFLPKPVQWLFRIRGSISSRLAPVALAVLIAVTIAVGAAHPRAAALVTLTLVVFVGASAIQFHERHFYYLQFVPWFAFGLIVQTVTHRVPMPYVRQAVAVSVVTAAALAAVLFATRAMQQAAVVRLLTRYESASRSRLSLDAQPSSDATLLTSPQWNGTMPAGSPRVATQFVAVEFDRSRCGGTPPAVTARYRASYPDADLSQTWMAPSEGAGASTMFVVVYDRADESIRFEGIEVPTQRAGCVAAISRVNGLDTEPLLLHAMLSDGWRDRPLYQRLR